MLKRIAICQLNERVAPRFNNSEELVLITLGKENQIIERKVVSTSVLDPEALVDLLSRLNVDTLICGGLKEKSQRRLDQLTIKCVDNVIGDVEAVVAKYLQGHLHSGDVID